MQLQLVQIRQAFHSLDRVIARPPVLTTRRPILTVLSNQPRVIYYPDRVRSLTSRSVSRTRSISPAISFTQNRLKQLSSHKQSRITSATQTEKQIKIPQTAQTQRQISRINSSSQIRQINFSSHKKKPPFPKQEVDELIEKMLESYEKLKEENEQYNKQMEEQEQFDQESEQDSPIKITEEYLQNVSVEVKESKSRQGLSKIVKSLSDCNQYMTFQTSKPKLETINEEQKVHVIHYNKINLSKIVKQNRASQSRNQGSSHLKRDKPIVVNKAPKFTKF
ncbi:hypothetical protein pb186bvf_002157 [Paramecium bursaria]